jgi:hypothetical protein
VEAGHHTRRLQGLTGLDVEEAQARRLLNDFDAYAASRDMQAEDRWSVAHSWLTNDLRAAAAAGPARGGRAAWRRQSSITTCCCTAGTCPSGPVRRSTSSTVARDYVRTVLPGKIAELKAAESRTDTATFARSSTERGRTLRSTAVGALATYVDGRPHPMDWLDALLLGAWRVSQSSCRSPAPGT